MAVFCFGAVCSAMAASREAEDEEDSLESNDWKYMEMEGTWKGRVLSGGRCD